MLKTSIHIYVPILIAMLSLFASCSDSGDIPDITDKPYTLEASPSEFTDLSSGTSTVSLAVYADILWEVSSLPAWVTADISTSYGNGFVKLTVAPNESTYPRTGIVQISSKQTGFSKSIEIHLTQCGKTSSPDNPDLPDNPDNPDNSDYYLNATPLEMLGIPHTGGSADLAITANVSWKISNLPAWISTDTLNGRNDTFVKLYFEPNTTNLERSALFSVTSAETLFTKSVTIRVTQSAPEKGGVTVVSFEVIGFSDEPWDKTSGGNSDFSKEEFPDKSWDKTSGGNSDFSKEEFPDKNWD